MSDQSKHFPEKFPTYLTLLFLLTPSICFADVEVAVPIDLLRADDQAGRRFVNVAVGREKTPTLWPLAGWQGQFTILEEPSGASFYSPSLLFDSKDTAWVFWIFNDSNNEGQFAYSEYSGNSWTDPEIIFPGVDEANFRLEAAMPDTASIWLVWHQVTSVGIRDVWYSHLSNQAWSAPARVHPANSTQDFAPQVAARGNEVWVVWTREESPDSAGIYVSRWSGSEWDPGSELSASIPGYHWFCDIAIGYDGSVNVVWQELNSKNIYFVRKEQDGGWSTPAVLNPPLLGVVAADWAAPAIECDQEGNVHVVWVGQVIGTGGVLEDWDIFYSVFDGELWSGPVRIHPGNENYDAYPDLVVNGPTDIWISWSASNPAAIEESPNMAVHWDGEKAIDLARIDDGVFEFDGIPVIASNSSSDPLVVWEADGVSIRGALVYNRYEAPVNVTFTNFRGLVSGDTAELSWDAAPRAFDYFEVEKEGEGGLFYTLARVWSDSRFSYEWQSDPLPPGNHVFRIQARGSDGVRTLGPVSLQIGEMLAGPQLRLLDTSPSKGELHLSVGIPEASEVTCDAIDVAGRLVAHKEFGYLPAGWSEVSFDLRKASGQVPNGVYWITFRDQSVRAVLIK